MRPVVIASTLAYLLSLIWVGAVLSQRATVVRTLGWTGTWPAPQRVETVDATGAAAGKLQVGDTILAVDGVTEFGGSEAPTTMLKSYPPGANYRLEISRDGRRLQSSLQVGHRTDRSRVPFIGAYIAGSLGFLVCGMLMALRRPESRTAQLGWWACCLTAFFYLGFSLQMLTSWSASPVEWLMILPDPWHQFAVYCFLASFEFTSTETAAWRVFRRVLMVLCAVSTLLRLPPAFLPWARWELLHYPVWLDSFRSMSSRFTVTALGIGVVAVVIRNYRLSQGPAQRRRIEIVAGAIAAGLVISTATSVYQMLQGGHAGLVALFLGNLAPLPIPVCFCYAVIAHQVLDIRLVVRRGLHYLLAKQVLRILAFLPVVIVAAFAILHPDAPMRSALNLTGLGLMVVSALCLEFHSNIQASVDRWFFRERFDREKLMRELLRELGRANSFERVRDIVCERLNWIYKPETVEVLREDDPCAIGAPYDSVLRVPIVGPSGVAMGGLLIGPRKSGDAFAESDLELFGLLASQIGLIREVLSLVENVRDTNRAVLQERTRIAQELHDTTGQGFAGISVYLAAAGKSLSGSPEQARTYLEAARKLAKTSAEDTRASVLGLRTSAVTAGGSHLEARLRRIGDRPSLAEVNTPTVEVDVPQGLCNLASEDAGWHLARVAEEAVTNAYKHAAASTIHVRLRTLGNILELTVKDDGSGFESTRTPFSSFGLQGMRERMGHVHGTVEISSVPGQGTEVRALVPVVAAMA